MDIDIYDEVKRIIFNNLTVQVVASADWDPTSGGSDLMVEVKLLFLDDVIAKDCTTVYLPG